MIFCLTNKVEVDLARPSENGYLAYQVLLTFE
jgi:hypothetical protein